jgi:SAM-dependent methyltransferase
VNSVREPRRPLPRHPSAGNLGVRPSLVEPPPSESYPAISFPVGAEEDSPLLLGPGLEPELTERLLGSLEGRRILELGAGNGRLGALLAGRGAKVICVDPSAERVADAREIAEAAGVKVEYHQADLADLAFIRADQIDLALAVYSLASVADLGRVFRQVDRVLRPEASLVLSLPHPFSIALAAESSTPPRLARRLFDDAPLTWDVDGESGLVHPHQIGEVVTTLWRSNFRVDTLLEPRATPHRHVAPAPEWVPTTLIVRARKQGV